MSPSDVIALLGSFEDLQFAKPVSILLDALRGDDAKISVSPHPVPLKELRDIYLPRRDLCMKRGIEIPGLNEVADRLLNSSAAGWTIVAVSTATLTGALFLGEGRGVACLASPKTE